MKSLLLFDDKPDMSIHLQKALQKSRYNVALANDVASVQRLVEKQHFDLIVITSNLECSPETPAHPRNDLSMVRKLRTAGVLRPILVHPVLNEDFVEVAPLNESTEEYIVKRSASFRVLLTRILAYFRREERLLAGN